MLPTFDLGGLGTLALEVARSWPKGDEHVFLGSRFPGTHPVLRPSYEALGPTEDVHRSLLHPMNFVDSMRDTVRKHGPFDGAVVYNFFDHVWYTMAANRGGLQGRVLCHVGTVLPNVEQTQLALQSPFTDSVRFVAASAAVADSLIVAGASPAKLFPVTWNGIDLKRFTPVKPAVDDGERRVVFGFTGRLCPDKDFDTLLRAFARLPPRVRARVQLRIAGGGPHRDELHQFARSLELTSDELQFVGALDKDKVHHFLEGLDVFVMAALPIEGMSMALVEAIVSGLPILATDVPSNREVLHGQAGHLTRGIDGLAQAVEWLTFDEHARLKLGGHSVAYREAFDVKRVVAKYRQMLID